GRSRSGTLPPKTQRFPALGNPASQTPHSLQYPSISELSIEVFGNPFEKLPRKIFSHHGDASSEKVSVSGKKLRSRNACFLHHRTLRVDAANNDDVVTPQAQRVDRFFIRAAAGHGSN